MSRFINIVSYIQEHKLTLSLIILGTKKNNMLHSREMEKNTVFMYRSDGKIDKAVLFGPQIIWAVY